MTRTMRRLQRTRLSTYTIILLVYLAWLDPWWNDSTPTSSPCESNVGHSSGFACALPVRVRKVKEESSTTTTTSDKEDDEDNNLARKLERNDYERKRTSLNKILVKAGKKGLGGGEFNNKYECLTSHILSDVRGMIWQLISLL